MSILQDIFRDHFEEMEYILHPRKSVMENVEKMINCGDPAFGHALYGCTNCGHLHFVPFRCHSRFCPTCGNMYSIKRTLSMSSKLVNCNHRHCVFTIPKELRIFFLNDRSLLNCLFTAVRSVMLRMFYNLNKSEAFTPGFICVLHTFGRPLEWNPHIHCIISEGGVGNISPWRSVTHFNYKLLRNSFCTALLNELEDHIGPSFKSTKSYIYKNCKNGFYVFAKPRKCNPKAVVKYIGRYLGRPVIATSRIDEYDGEFVTFHYNRHEDNVLVTKKLLVLDFMELLIQHIPEKHFKMIRYYGLYARHLDKDKKLVRALTSQDTKYYCACTHWKTSIFLSFGYNPLKCPCCGEHMSLLELRFNHKYLSLDELFRKVMSKSSHSP